MDHEQIHELLESVRSGALDVEAALDELAALDTAQLECARVDHHRSLRCGFPEVIFAPGKRPEDLVRIALEILAHHDRLLITRVDESGWSALRSAIPGARHHELARAVTVETTPAAPRDGPIGLITAGTGDAPIAEEARVTAQIMGCEVETYYDCGVAGIHRLLEVSRRIRTARVTIVVAGMEGALPSVVGGLVAHPVIAVPTSIGYGASFAGLAPLLAMLNSCAAGVTVVNIDNGFGAGYAAALMLRSASRGESPNAQG